VWERIAHATGDPDLEEVQVDSTTIKAHPVASTSRRERDEKKKTPTPDAASAEAVADRAPTSTPPSTVGGGCFG
jgi:hypothetical protein